MWSFGLGLSLSRLGVSLRLLLAGLPPEGSVAAGVGLVVALPHEGILKHEVGEQSNGSPLLHGPAVDIVDVALIEGDLSLQVKAPVGLLVRSPVQEDHGKRPAAVVCRSALLYYGDGAGVEVREPLLVRVYEVAPGALYVPLGEGGVGVPEAALGRLK